MGFLQHLWLWIEIHTGTVNESGPYYGFWSGFGSDIGEVTILGSIIIGARHINCAEKGCWRLGHVIPGTTVRTCHKHHPTNPRDKRNGSVAEMHEAQK